MVPILKIERGRIDFAAQDDGDIAFVVAGGIHGRAVNRGVWSGPENRYMLLLELL